MKENIKNGFANILSTSQEISNRQLKKIMIIGWVLLSFQLIKTSSNINFGELTSQIIQWGQSLTVFNSAKPAPIIVPEFKAEIESSLFAKQILEINKRWPKAILVEQGSTNQSEVLKINGIQVLLTDKNRPRVNQQVAQELNILMAQIKRLSGKVQMRIMAGKNILTTYTTPLTKYFYSFYGLKGQIITAADDNSLEIQIEVQK